MLPEGWVFVDDSHNQVVRDGLGAFHEGDHLLVWVRPPKQEKEAVLCVTAWVKKHDVGAPKIIFDRVWDRWTTQLWEKTG